MKGEYLEGKPIHEVNVKGTLFKHKRGSRYCYRVCFPGGNVSSRTGLNAIVAYLNARPSVARRMSLGNTEYYTLNDCIKGPDNPDNLVIETLKPTGNYATIIPKRTKEPKPISDKCYSPNYGEVYRRIQEHRNYVIGTLGK